MILLLITLCTSTTMDDCQVHQLGQFPTEQRCEVVAGIHRAILTEGAEQNYRLECVQRERVE